MKYGFGSRLFAGVTKDKETRKKPSQLVFGWLRGLKRPTTNRKKKWTQLSIRKTTFFLFFLCCELSFNQVFKQNLLLKLKLSLPRKNLIPNKEVISLLLDLGFWLQFVLIGSLLCVNGSLLEQPDQGWESFSYRYVSYCIDLDCDCVLTVL